MLTMEKVPSTAETQMPFLKTETGTLGCHLASKTGRLADKQSPSTTPH